MLEREAGRDDRGRNEGDGRDRERLGKGLSVAAALLVAALVNAGREGDATSEEAGERANLLDAAARVRDRVTPGGSSTATSGGAETTTPGGGDLPDVEWSDLADAERLADLADVEWTNLPAPARSAAQRYRSDERLRKGAPVAAALLAGLLLGGRRDEDASAEATPDRRGDATDAVTRVRRRLGIGGTRRADAERVTDRLDSATETAARSAGAGSGTGGSGTAGTGNGTTEPEGEAAGSAGQTSGPESAAARAATTATGIDANVEDLSAPTTGGMPMLGFGTYRRADYDECLESVRQALGVGYRHIDTTDRRSAYYAEEAVGDAVADSGVDREDAFVATKVTPADLDHVRTSAEESLDRLGMEYVDLLYVHWPTHDYEPTETLEAFAQLRAEGLVDRIGVSNFTVDLLEEALEVSAEPIFANQVEMHPLLPQEELREFCERAGVEPVAYSPIARGQVEDVTELQEVADKHGATPEQVSLAWLREKDVTAIPRATSEDHMRENWRSLALELDVEDVLKLDSIDERRRIVDPDDAPWN